MREFTYVCEYRLVITFLAGALILINLATTNGAAVSSWYQGCFHLPEANIPQNITKQPLHYTSIIQTPATCSKKCLDNDVYSFAFLYAGSKCFCWKGTLRRRKVHEANCNIRCSGDSRVKCGGRKSTSVYSTNGPFIRSLSVVPSPSKLLKNEELSLIIRVELAADVSTPIGIKRLDRLSRDVRTTVRLDVKYDYVMDVTGKRGILVVKHIYSSEGFKTIDVDVENGISSLSARNYAHVASRIPKMLKVEYLARQERQASCIPILQELKPIHRVVFANQLVQFQASVKDGFNITFIWNFCDMEYRNVSQHTEESLCSINSVCQSQRFSFNRTGICKIEVEVYNEYGSTESSLYVAVIYPEFRDITLVALEQELESDAQEELYSDNNPPPPWRNDLPSLIGGGWPPFGDPTEGIHEGGADLFRGYGSATGTSYGDEYQFAYPSRQNYFPNDQEREVNEVKSIELERGQYLKETKIKFEAVYVKENNDMGSVYMTNKQDIIKVEVDFGDGNVISQKIVQQQSSYVLSESRLRRDTRNDLEWMRRGESYADKLQRIVLGIRKFSTVGAPGTNVEDLSTKYRAKRTVDRNLFSLPEDSDPYSSDVYMRDASPSVTYSSRRGEFMISDYDNWSPSMNRPAIQINYFKGCTLRMNFEYTYNKSGIYNVTLSVHTKMQTLSAHLKDRLVVLNGTNALIIRCPAATEIGKSIILTASSATELPKILTWRVFQRLEDYSWTRILTRKQLESSFKKSFLKRGTYKIEVASPDDGLFSSCALQVEEPLAGLSISIVKTFVKTGDKLHVRISLVAGTAVVTKVQYGDKLEVLQEKSHSKTWDAFIEVRKVECHRVVVTAENAVSNITLESDRVCGEEQISGFRAEVPHNVGLGQTARIRFLFASGSNINLEVKITSVTGRILSFHNYTDFHADITKVVMTPKFLEPGKYHIHGRAFNSVPAKSENCEKTSEVTSLANIRVGMTLESTNKLTLKKKEMINEDDAQPAFLFMVYIDDSLYVGVDGLYQWSLQNFSSITGKLNGQILQHYTASPIVAVTMTQCDILLIPRLSNIDLLESPTQNYSAHSTWQCRVNVNAMSYSENLERSYMMNEKSAYVNKKQMIAAKSYWPELHKSTEFSIKCPTPEESCEVDFGDGSISMKIYSQSDWKMLSHVYSDPGLYKITLFGKASNGKVNEIAATHVNVEEKIRSNKIEGVQQVMYEVNNAHGSWHAVTTGGSQIIYHWSVRTENYSLLHDEYTREKEWEYIFPDYGLYNISVATFNEISWIEDSLIVNVDLTPWYFDVTANDSILGEPTIFFVETNATGTVLAAEFNDDGKVEKYDLSCMEPNETYYLNDKRIAKYRILHQYKDIGSHHANFTLLSSHEKSNRKHRLQTNVLHKPAPNEIKVEVMNHDAVQSNGKYYLATGTETVIMATTNYRTVIFTWIVWKKHGSSREVILSSPTEAHNSSFSKFTYVIEQHGLLEITVTSYPTKLSSSIVIEGEERIRNVWIDKPFYKGFVNYCRLRKYQINNTYSEMKCDNVTLEGRSDGTHVTFYFEIRFRKEILGDYSVPTDIVDVIRATGSQNLDGSENEASIQYTFRKQGVYHITVIASNHLGNLSASREEIFSSGKRRQFLFYAQRPVSRIMLSRQKYYVAKHNLTTFQIIQINSDQVLQIRWEMGDGTTLIGSKVQHAYSTTGWTEITVTARNYVNRKTAEAKVKVETPIESVKLQELSKVYSTEEDVRLQAVVMPDKSAWNYTWYLTNDNSTKNVPYLSFIDHHFPESGMYLVKVIAANGISSMESEPITIEIQEVIRPIFIGDEVVQRNELVVMEVRLTTGSDASISWMIDDGPVIASTFKISHLFERIGIYTLRIDIRNKLVPRIITKRIFVVNQSCDLPDVKITGHSRNRLIITRSKLLRLEAEVILNCSIIATLNYNWILQPYDDYLHDEIGDFDYLDQIERSKRVLEIPPRTLAYGIYRFTVNVSIDSSILFSESTILVDVRPSKLLAIINGGTMRDISCGDDVTLNANPSYDPDFPEENGTLSFQWQCFVLNSPKKPCFITNYDDEEDMPASSMTTPDTRSHHVTSSMRAAEAYQRYSVDNVDSIYKQFPPAVQSNLSSLTFPASLLNKQEEAFVFKVDVSKIDRDTESTFVIIKIKQDPAEWVNIHCEQCTRNSVIRHETLILKASCETCTKEDHDGIISYHWLLQEVEDDSSSSFYENETSDCAPPDGSGWMRLIGIVNSDNDLNKTELGSDSYRLPQGEDYQNNVKDRNDTGKRAFENFEVGNPVLNDRYTALKMAGTSSDNSASQHHARSQVSVSLPSHAHNLEEGDAGSRTFSFENRLDYYAYQQPGFFPNSQQSYRSGITQSSFLPSNDENELTGDQFRNQEVFSDLAPVKHYQDMRHAYIPLNDVSLNGMNAKSLVMQTDNLIEGKTYVITVKVKYQHDRNSTKVTHGSVSYYFTVLRGPSYGECSVSYRKTTRNYQVHCIQWKNQQNDNISDQISIKEILNYDISYSLTRYGKTRQIYNGVGFERSFQLPPSDQQEYIHIKLRNSDGAKTNVCSFPVNVTHGSQAFSSVHCLREAYTMSLAKDSELKKVIGGNDHEAILSISNVILDTIPQKNPLNEIGTFMGASAVDMMREVVTIVVQALQHMQPIRPNEIHYIISTLSDALSRKDLYSIEAIFEATELFKTSISRLQKIRKRTDLKINFDDNYELINLLIHVRIQLFDAFKWCAQQIEDGSKESILLSKEWFKIKNTSTDTREQEIAVINGEMSKLEEEAYNTLKFYLLEEVARRPDVLGALHSFSGKFGIVIQRFKKRIQVYKHVKNSTGPWKIGAVFPDYLETVLYRSEPNSSFFQIASTFPDRSLRGFKEGYIENNPVSVTVYNNAAGVFPLRNLHEPIIVALPPRHLNKVFIRGRISRNQVTINSFPVYKLANHTLHVEIELDSRERRSFPVTITINDENTRDSTGTPDLNNAIAKKVISRNQFKHHQELNLPVIVKFVLRNDDFRQEYATYFVSLWNEQSMTSRSRHYDTQTLSYTLRIWWSDCYYWDKYFKQWRQDGIQVLKESTSSQTLCSTNHLSTFSGSYLTVRAETHHANDIGIAIQHTALPGIVVVLSFILLVTITFLCLHHRVLRFQEIETQFNLENARTKSRFCNFEKKIRWFLGPERKARSPVIVYDNRKSHRQVFRVTFETNRWPGSGTTSNVIVVLYGENGKYDARELITPRTHCARVARHENSYSDNDHHTGIDDELFITGSTQSFILTFPESLGPIWKISLWHDHSGECPGWKLDKVIIQDLTRKEKLYFPCNRWLALDRGRRSISIDLRPILSPPSFCTQIGAWMYSFLCNYSSVYSLMIAPGCGPLARSQRAIHLLTFVFSVCALTTARYFLKLNVYSHDTNLPYWHASNVTWGSVIGVLSLLIVLPAQLLLRMSRHDERISVMIEDATASSFGGSGFINASHHHSSSLSMDKLYLGSGSYFIDTGQRSPFRENPKLKVTTMPSVEDTVYDWLELKAMSENKEDFATSTQDVNKDFLLPKPHNVGRQWHESVSSLDEEIMRCMTASPSHQIHVNQDDAENDCSIVKKSCSVGSLDNFESIASHVPQGQSGKGLKAKVDIAVYPPTFKKYDRYAGKDIDEPPILAMDRPELVPCEKLKPIPRELNSLLPRNCRKLAWIYYISICVFACAGTLCGSIHTVRSYDFCVWLECVLVSLISTMMFSEGLIIFLMALGFSAYNFIRWLVISDDLVSLLDRMYPNVDLSGPDENPIVNYVDHSPFYPVNESFSHINDNMFWNDMQLTRRIADRERSRYLRHVTAPTIAPPVKMKLVKKRHLKNATEAWISVIILLILGVTMATVVSQGTIDAMSQSKDVEAWFKRADSVEYIDVNNSSSNSVSFQDLRSRQEWLAWFDKIVLNSPRTEKTTQFNHAVRRPTDYLLHDLKDQRPAMKYSHVTSYVLVGRPILKIKSLRYDETTRILPKMAALLNYPHKRDMVDTSKTAEGKREFGIERNQNEILYKIPSSVPKKSKSPDILSELKNVIQRGRNISGLSIEMILHNPFTDLYSYISASTKFYNDYGLKNVGNGSKFSTVTVKSLTLSQNSLKNSESFYSRKAFYICQFFLFSWFFFKIMLAFDCAAQSLSRYTTTMSNSNNNSCMVNSSIIKQIAEGTIDFCIWLFIVFCFTLSIQLRNQIEKTIPFIYGYENPQMIKNDLGIDIVVQRTSRMAVSFGFFNFLLIIKVCVIANKYHGFPSRSSSSAKKISANTIFSILLLFITALFVLAFIGHMLFMDEFVFHTPLHSIATVLQSAITFSAVSARSRVNMVSLKRKYGLLPTVFFFVILIFVLRLILRAILLVACKRTNLKCKKRENQKKICINKSEDELISAIDLCKFNMERIKQFFWTICNRSNVLARGRDMEFSSLHQEKGKKISSYERKKLGSTSRSSFRPMSVKEELKETTDMEPLAFKNDSSCPYNKYDLPSNVWLVEIESQLDELYSRASILAEIACKEVISDSKTFGISSEDAKGHTAPVKNIVNKKAGDRISNLLNKQSPDPMKINRIRKPPVQERLEKRTSLKQKENSSSASDEQKMQYLDGCITPKPNNSIISLPKSRLSENSTSSLDEESGERTHTMKKVTIKQPARVGTLSDDYNKEQIIINTSPPPRYRKYGWISEDDLVDNEEDSENLSIPPLTARNLAKHNFTIISRQSSVTSQKPTGTGNGSKAFHLSDIPCTSKAVEKQVEATETYQSFPQRIWKSIFSFAKRHINSGTNIETESKRRPLRRSRTTAINLKDIPSLESLQDSDAESDITGKKSSASTSKLKTVFKTASPVRVMQAFRSNNNQIQEISAGRFQSVTPQKSEVLSSSRGSNMVLDDGYDTFSVPGTVSETEYKIVNSTT